MSLQAAFAEEVRAGGRAALVTVIEPDAAPGARRGAKLLVRADGGAQGSLGARDLDREAVAHAEELMWAERSELRHAAGARLFVDVTAPAPRLVIFGAIDLAGDLCRIARTVGWRPYVVDPRARFALPERFPDAEVVVAGWPAEAFGRIGGIDRATYICVLTHDPKLDDAALELALASQAPYVGAMGSRRAQEKRRERLLARGISDERQARISAPIGLDLGGITPEETALSIMAEVVASRNGRRGGRLAHASGRIHEVGA